MNNDDLTVNNKDYIMSDEENKGKVVQMRGRKTKFEDNKKKTDRMDSETLAYSILMRSHVLCPLEDLPFVFNYSLYFDGRGGVVILKYIPQSKTYQIISPKNVASSLFREFGTWKRKFPDMAAQFTLSMDVAKKGVEAWLGDDDGRFNNALMEEMPQDIAFRSEEIACLNRLDYDPKPSISLEQNAPIFSKMLKRLTNAEAFCKKIGSLFDSNSDRKQTIWLYGPSNGGKSAIQRLVSEIVGGNNVGSISIQEASLKGEFAKAQLVGKRVWNINEATPAIFRMGEYKTLTGDDNHTINQKFKDAYTIDLKGHMILTSNYAPEIPNDDALKARIIPCYAEPVPEDERISQKALMVKLKEEIPYIVYYCMELYKKTRGKSIEFDDSALLEEINNSELSYEAEFGKSYVFDEKIGKDEAKITINMIKDQLFPGLYSSNDKSFKEFLKWLRGHEGVSKFQKRVGGAKPYFITGVREANAQEKREILNNPYIR